MQLCLMKWEGITRMADAAGVRGGVICFVCVDMMYGLVILLVSFVVLQDFLLMQFMVSSLEMWISAEHANLLYCQVISILPGVLSRFKRLLQNNVAKLTHCTDKYMSERGMNNSLKMLPTIQVIFLLSVLRRSWALKFFLPKKGFWY